MVNNNIEFFAGRKWVDRGVRYLEINDDVLDEAAQENLELMTVLQSELEEVDAAYSKERLAAIVAESLGKSTASQGECQHKRTGPPFLRSFLSLILSSLLPLFRLSSSTTTAHTTAPSEATTNTELNLENVDRYCDLAEQGSEEALTILAAFVASREV
jgi:hypothetical protein